MFLGDRMPIFKLEGDDISNSKLVIAEETNIELESHLENWLENSPPAIAQEPILWIGRQTSASVEDSTIFPDLLGLDAEGNLVIVELKRDKAPRDVVAQLLEYATWANDLSVLQIQQIAEAYYEIHENTEDVRFDDLFKESFELAESDDVPTLNRNLRLFIVAGNLPSGVIHVCRFLRTSYGMDVNCILVSTYETETGERLISMEKIVGDEVVTLPKMQRKLSSNSPLWSRETERKIIWNAVNEITDGKSNIEFTLQSLKNYVLGKYPKFNPNTVLGILVADTVNNDPSFSSSGENKYMRIKSGVYRLYNPDIDMLVDDKET